MSKKISVIIPIYNSEKYLKRCLDSICLQMYENLEIICINDGSTDNSLKILEEYSLKDNRIKIFSKPNSGQSKARNKGLELASGEYISFIDSDDFVSLCLYKKFIETIAKNDVDIYMFNYVQYKEFQQMVETDLNFGFNVNTWEYEKEKIYSINDCKNPFIGNMSASNKIYKKSFLDEYNIKFQENIIFEDRLFHFMTLFKAKSIYINNDILYWYRKVQNSTMNTIAKNTFDIFKVLNSIKTLLKEENQFERFKYYLLRFEYEYFYFLVKEIEKQCQNEFFIECKKELNSLFNQNCSIEICKNLNNFHVFVDFMNLNLEEFLDKYK